MRLLVSVGLSAELLPSSDNPAPGVSSTKTTGQSSQATSESKGHLCFDQSLALPGLDVEKSFLIGNANMICGASKQPQNNAPSTTSLGTITVETSHSTETTKGPAAPGDTVRDTLIEKKAITTPVKPTTSKVPAQTDV